MNATMMGGTGGKGDTVRSARTIKWCRDGWFQDVPVRVAP